MTPQQEELKRKHGSPAEFAEACYRAVPGFVSVDEANAAIRKYQREWNEAGPADDLIDYGWCVERLGRKRVGRLYSGGVWIAEIQNEQDGQTQWLFLPRDMTRTEALLVMRLLRIKHKP